MKYDWSYVELPSLKSVARCLENIDATNVHLAKIVCRENPKSFVVFYPSGIQPEEEAK